MAGLPIGVVGTGFVHSGNNMIRAATGVVEEKPIKRGNKIVFEKSITIKGDNYGPETPVSKIKMKVRSM